MNDPRSYKECDGLRGVSDMTEAWQLVHENERLRDEVASLRELADKRGSIAVKRRLEIQRLRLTDKEREAVELAIDSMSGVEDISASWSERETAAIATLRGLLERHFPVPENSPPQDNAPETHSNQSEASVRLECAIAPAWMAKPFWVDPAAGWSYGFPKLYDPAKDGNMTAWLIANGYPRYLADQNLPCTFTAKIDSQ